MSTLDDVRTLRGIALRLLPGFWQARAQLSVAIRVPECFARDAEHGLTTEHYTPSPVDPQIRRTFGCLTVSDQLTAFLFRQFSRGLQTNQIRHRVDKPPTTEIRPPPCSNSSTVASLIGRL
jgi:hypothetical protein